jgi:hypothetical protein
MVMVRVAWRSYEEWGWGGDGLWAGIGAAGGLAARFGQVPLLATSCGVLNIILGEIGIVITHIS